MAILTVNNIKKMFGTDVIIQDITFEVRKATVLALWALTAPERRRFSRY